MQAIAEENNLSETAFVVPQDTVGHYALRWFTPSSEIDFCGHATIATAHALAQAYQDPHSANGGYIFDTKIGRLNVTVSGKDYSLTAPTAQPHPTALTQEMRRAFPMPLELAFLAGDNLYITAQNPADITAYKPDISAIIALSNHGVGLTAQGGQDGADFTSRFFVPAMGIEEDPVTGSAHAALAPYWSQRLGKENLRAYQASVRGGWLALKLSSKHVIITGPAVTFAKSEIYLP